MIKVGSCCWLDESVVESFIVPSISRTAILMNGTESHLLSPYHKKDSLIIQFGAEHAEITRMCAASIHEIPDLKACSEQSSNPDCNVSYTDKVCYREYNWNSGGFAHG